MRTILILLLTAPTLWAQPVPVDNEAEKSAATGAYLVPFASQDNRLEFTLVSAEGTAKSNVIRLQNTPAWIAVAPTEITLDTGQENALAVFSFTVAESAPVGEVADLVFKVSQGDQEVAEKVISIEVDVPRELALKGNYPNPFNPTTKIGFTLAEDAAVQIRVYNSLGQEVTQLMSGDLSPGNHAVDWNAAGLPSGVYFYRLEAVGRDGSRSIRQAKMTLLK